jgi:ABC-type branched-subunit amino acid transport system substrate-binding protein
MAVPLMALAACGSSNDGGSSSSTGGGGGGGGNTPTKIGFIVDKTGPLAPIGGGYARGVEIAAAQWNADSSVRPVEVESCDSQSTGDGAIACYQKLRSSVDAISGPSLFVGLASVRSLAAKGEVPLVSGAPLVDPPAGSPIFQTIPTIPDGIGASFKYFKSKGWTKVALLTSNDEPGNLAKGGAEKLAGQYGMTLTTEQVFDPTAQNLAGQAENIAAAKPDVVLAWTAGPQLITALRALQAAGVKVPIMLNYASMSTALLSKAGPEATANILFFASRAFDAKSIEDAAWRKRVEDFDTRFKAKNKFTPDLTAYDAGDTIFAIGAAAKEDTSQKAILDALNSGMELPGLLYQTYKYTPDNHIGISGPDVFDILKWLPADQTWELAK